MKVSDTPENVKKCICASCPSYNECMKTGNEALFCSKGKSACDVKREGCICNQCPVHSAYHLLGAYYCSVGTGWDEDLGKAIKTLIGATFVPFKVAADIATDVSKNLEAAIPQPTKVAASIIEGRIWTLKTITKAIEKEIAELQEYKKKLEAEEEQKKETVKVE
jgi:hypothetical protein